jgi:hypothetical protein
MIAVVFAALVMTGMTWAATATSVSQWGITWTFDKVYEVGQFCNGDWWVQGPVTITAMTPAFTGTRNGWEVNPSQPTRGNQGFDSRVGNFNSSLVPSLPYTAAANASIVKIVSNDSPVGCQNLKTAAVLTVLASVPPDSGATVFRPPYYGSAKPLYSTHDLHTELLPSLAPVANTPALADMAASFQRVQFEHKFVTDGCMNPSDNQPGYGAVVNRRNGEGALRLMLNEPIAEKMPLLIYYVQYGIDIYHMYINGISWPDDGGHGAGRKLPPTFAAVVLDNQAMKAAISASTRDNFQEQWLVTYGKSGAAIFNMADHGYAQGEWERRGWEGVRDGFEGAPGYDVYGYIDGPLGNYYMYCCHVKPYKPNALAIRLMPELVPVWNFPAYLDFTDRWVNFGVWTQPDPCAPYDGNWSNYGITFGPDGHGDCIRDADSSDGIGRFPSLHGTKADDGYYGSAFADAMWTVYRDLPSGVNTGRKPGSAIIRGDFIKKHPITGDIMFDFKNFTATENFSLIIYDNHGVPVKSCSRFPGSHQIVWGKNSAPTGVYFYSLQIDRMMYSGKLVKL